MTDIFNINSTEQESTFKYTHPLFITNQYTNDCDHSANQFKICVSGKLSSITAWSYLISATQ